MSVEDAIEEAPASGANDATESDAHRATSPIEGIDRESEKESESERNLPAERNNLRLDRIFTRRGREVRPPKRMDL